MENTIKMFIETPDKKTLEQEVPVGLIDIYREKGWKEVQKEEKKPIEKTETSFFASKKNKNKK